MIISGNKIRKLMFDRNTKQYKFAKECGICRQTLSKILKNKNVQVHSMTALKISENLGLNLEDLKGGE